MLGQPRAQDRDTLVQPALGVARAEPVHVRIMTEQEGRRFQQIVRRSSANSVRYRRATMLPASAGGNRVPVNAQLVQADDDTVRDVIHRFNEIGLASLDLRGREAAPACSVLTTRTSSCRRPPPAPTMLGHRRVVLGRVGPARATPRDPPPHPRRSLLPRLLLRRRLQPVGRQPPREGRREHSGRAPIGTGRNGRSGSHSASLGSPRPRPTSTTRTQSSHLIRKRGSNLGLSRAGRRGP